MCECSLLIDADTSAPIVIPGRDYQFTFSALGQQHVLLKGIRMDGIIDYAAAYKIEGSNGVRRGYMFIVGERDLADNIVGAA